MRLSIKYQVIIFLVLFAVFIALKNHDKIFLINTLIAVIAAVLVESAFLFFKRRTFSIHDSAIISGLIVGFVLADTNKWWLFCLAAIIAILSKYFIRYHQKHIFNPAALGIVLTSILFGAQTEWHGTFLWYILLPAGIYFAYKINRLKLLLGYGIVSLPLFVIPAFIQHVNLLTIIGYYSYFYIFIMLIEPKTTPAKTYSQFVFGAGVALTIYVLNQFNLSFEIELAVLLMFNLLVPWLNKLSEKRIV